MNHDLYMLKGEITSRTMAILPRKTKGGKIGSSIMEDSEKYFVQDPPSKVIDLACKFFGASLYGRQIGTKEVSNMTHKLPISIDPTNGIYFFPTLSPSNSNCAWISHSHIKDVVEVEKQLTQIFFKNGLSAMVKVSYGSLENQINRTAQYRFILDERINRLRLGLGNSDDQSE